MRRHKASNPTAGFQRALPSLEDAMTDIDIIDTPLSDEPSTEQKTEAPSEETQETEEPTEESTEEMTEEAAEETAEEDPESVSEEEKPRKRRSAQKRISELTRARHTAEREAQTLRQQLEALQANATPAAEPKQEDFQSYDDFVVARAEFRAAATVDKRLDTLAKTVQQNQSQAEHTARAADWEVKVEDARDKYDDFDDVALNPDVPISNAMAEALGAEENGTDIAYHLGKHPKLSREIAALSPMQAVLRIGKLSAKLAEGPKRKPTSTPDPVKVLKAPGVAPMKSISQMTQKEYEAARKSGKLK